MGPLRKKLKKILSREFPTPDKIVLRDDEQVIILVTSARFRGLEPYDRVDIIWNILEKELSAAERKEVAITVALTPEEELAHAASFEWNSTGSKSK
jgi:stress-induced morphogen